MDASQKVSPRPMSIKRGSSGGYIRRRRTQTYSAVFFLALLIGILSAIGFLGLLAVAMNHS